MKMNMYGRGNTNNPFNNSPSVRGNINSHVNIVERNQREKQSFSLYNQSQMDQKSNVNTQKKSNNNIFRSPGKTPQKGILFANNNIGLGNNKIPMRVNIFGDTQKTPENPFRSTISSQMAQTPNPNSNNIFLKISENNDKPKQNLQQNKESYAQKREESDQIQQNFGRKEEHENKNSFTISSNHNEQTQHKKLNVQKTHQQVINLSGEQYDKKFSLFSKGASNGLKTIFSKKSQKNVNIFAKKENTVNVNIFKNQTQIKSPHEQISIQTKNVQQQSYITNNLPNTQFPIQQQVIESPIYQTPKKQYQQQALSSLEQQNHHNVNIKQLQNKRDHFPLSTIRQNDFEDSGIKKNSVSGGDLSYFNSSVVDIGYMDDQVSSGKEMFNQQHNGLISSVNHNNARENNTTSDKQNQRKRPAVIQLKQNPSSSSAHYQPNEPKKPQVQIQPHADLSFSKQKADRFSQHTEKIISNQQQEIDQNKTIVFQEQIHINQQQFNQVIVNQVCVQRMTQSQRITNNYIAKQFNEQGSEEIIIKSDRQIQVNHMLKNEDNDNKVKRQKLNNINTLETDKLFQRNLFSQLRPVNIRKTQSESQTESLSHSGISNNHKDFTTTPQRKKQLQGGNYKNYREEDEVKQSKYKRYQQGFQEDNDNQSLNQQQSSTQSNKSKQTDKKTTKPNTQVISNHQVGSTKILNQDYISQIQEVQVNPQQGVSNILIEPYQKYHVQTINQNKVKKFEQIQEGQIDINKNPQSRISQVSDNTISLDYSKQSSQYIHSSSNALLKNKLQDQKNKNQLVLVSINYEVQEKKKYTENQFIQRENQNRNDSIHDNNNEEANQQQIAPRSVQRRITFGQDIQNGVAKVFESFQNFTNQKQDTLNSRKNTLKQNQPVEWNFEHKYQNFEQRQQQIISEQKQNNIKIQQQKLQKSLQDQYKKPLTSLQKQISFAIDINEKIEQKQQPQQNQLSHSGQKNSSQLQILQPSTKLFQRLKVPPKSPTTQTQKGFNTIKPLPTVQQIQKSILQLVKSKQISIQNIVQKQSTFNTPPSSSSPGKIDLQTLQDNLKRRSQSIEIKQQFFKFKKLLTQTIKHSKQQLYCLSNKHTDIDIYEMLVSQNKQITEKIFQISIETFNISHLFYILNLKNPQNMRQIQKNVRKIKQFNIRAGKVQLCVTKLKQNSQKLNEIEDKVQNDIKQLQRVEKQKICLRQKQNKSFFSMFNMKPNKYFSQKVTLKQNTNQPSGKNVTSHNVDYVHEQAITKLKTQKYLELMKGNLKGIIEQKLLKVAQLYKKTQQCLKREDKMQQFPVLFVCNPKQKIQKQSQSVFTQLIKKKNIEKEQKQIKKIIKQQIPSFLRIDLPYKFEKDQQLLKNNKYYKQLLDKFKQNLDKMKSSSSLNCSSNRNQLSRIQSTSSTRTINQKNHLQKNDSTQQKYLKSAKVSRIPQLYMLSDKSKNSLFNTPQRKLFQAQKQLQTKIRQNISLKLRSINFQPQVFNANQIIRNKEPYFHL